jgi:hypothetical protein
MSKEPWAYVAHKDGMMGGVCATSISKKSLGEFLSEFAADGFALHPVFNREEYLAFIKDMPAWHGDAT